MKNNFIIKSIFRTLLVALCLLTVGVGEICADVWIRGDMNSWSNSDDWKFSDGKLEVSLDANTDYTFKVWDEVDYENNHYRSYDLQSGKITGTIIDYNLDKDNVEGYNLVLHTAEAGTYIFHYKYEDSKYKLSIYFPRARFDTEKVMYFDASESNWTESNCERVRYYYKYYDSNSDQSNADCAVGEALETKIFYTSTPNNSYVGNVQIGKVVYEDNEWKWKASVDEAHGRDRSSTKENCVKLASSGKTVSWTTYCPPMSSVTLSDNGTTTWGGNGSSGSPYLVPTDADIKVHVTASVSALNDANMTKYFLFKKADSAVGDGSTTTDKTLTASSTTGTKEAVIVEAYNYYNSTEGTHLASSAIYYEARTPYTISYNAGTNGSGSRASETKLKGVNFTLPSSAVFERTGYTQTGWTTSDGGTQTHALGGSYTGDAAQTFYPVWTANEYTVTLNNRTGTTPGTPSVSVTYNSTTGLTSAITKPTKTYYDFGGYYTSTDNGVTITETQLIDAEGNWVKNVSTYTGASGNNPTWIYAGDITLYAKWTEHDYAITINIVGSGSTSPASSTTAKYVTPSGDITATPSTGYSFREWSFSKVGESDYDVYADDANSYSSTSNPIHILAQRDGTMTANFTANGYTVTLENMDADEGHKGTENVSVTYDATTGLTTAITKPEKEHYVFGGYYISTNKGSSLTDIQLIDADGNWKKDITNYTSHSGDNPTWVCAGDTTLYAKWTETAYTITPSVSPAGAGSVNTVTDAHIITASSTITATPANAAWIFDYWEYGTHVGKAGGDGNAITVTSDMNSTITAHFKPRFSLVGSLQDDSGEGGMPGWGDYTKTFAVNSTSPMDLTRTCILQANKTYKVQVHDNATSINLGRSGCVPVCVLEENASLLMENSNNDVFLYTSGAGEYIFKITAIDGSDHPTLTVLRPYPVNFGQKYEDIDGTLHAGTTGGTAAATAGGDALTSGDFVTYNTSVTHTATPASGYTFAGWWSSDAFEGDAFSNTNPMTYAVTFGDNTYAKFVETSTSVTLANDGHGKVQIGGVDKTNTTCGVTTTRSLTAVPNAGYKFSSWDKSGDDITLSSTSTNPTTLTGLGSGLDEGQTVTANFVERYSIKGTMNGEAWGTTHTLSNIGTNAGSKDTCYVTMTLPANTTYEFAIYDEQTGGWYKASTVAVYNMTYTNHTNWEFGDTKTYNCGITTAGKGTYKFIFNITDTTVTVVYPTSYQVNYGASPSVGGNITVVDDDSQAVPNGGYVRSGGSVTYTAAAASGYTFVGWCNNDSYGDTFNTELSWTNSNVTETQNSFAKFKSTNFVIYRTGDMSSDPRAAYDDVESYAGGTISEVIELRMKVHELDKWYSLYLPYNVDSVCVYDVDEAKYYKMQPYFRKTLDGKLYAGHYIIRKPELTNDSIALSNFGDWRDPVSSTFTPSGNTPYIIQWHNSYFEGKYVSFFGAAGQSIASSFSEGEAPKTKNWVTVHGNNSMKSGSVVDAYTLDGDEIWVRPVDKGESVAILPFECYIRANSEVTNKYLVLRRGMNTDDTPTGWESVSIPSKKASKVLMDGQLYIIRGNQIYTIQGALVK